MHGRIFLILAITKLFTLIQSTFAQQQLLTFDDIPISGSGGVLIPPTYGGLHWTNIIVGNQSSELRRAAVSLPNYARTIVGGSALMYSSTPFDLDSAWVTVAATGTVEFRVVAMFGPVSLYTNSYSFVGNTPTLLQFGLENITGARMFTSSPVASFGLDDIAISNIEDRHYSVPGWFKPGEIIFTSSDALAVAAGDLNHDSQSELIISSRAGTTVGVNTNGGFLRREITSTNFFTIGNANFIAIGDYTGDGHDDAVISTMASFSGPTAVTRLIEFTNYLNFTTNGISNVFGVVAVGDFGGTNRLIASQQQNWLDIAAADFNSDDKLDYATLSGDSLQQAIFISTNRGNAVFGNASTLFLSTGHFAIAVNDFDGDNDIDIATVNQNTGALYIAYNSGRGAFPTSTNYQTGLVRPVSLASADLDGDRIPEIVVRNAFSGLSLLRGLGGGRYSTPIIITDGAGYPSTNNFPRSIALRDLNSDGTPDIAFISGSEVVTLYNIFPPRLNIAQIEDVIEVHWSTNYAKGAVIEYTSELGPNAVWTQDTFPQFEFGNTRAIFDSGRNPQLFFRLRRPE